MPFGRSTPGGRRWPRGQKFTLSAPGAEAEAGYRAAVAEARASGRAALDAALAAWAAPLGVKAGDGILLRELSGKRAGIADLVRELEPAGIEANEVREAIDRLVTAGIVEAVPLASQAA